MIGGCGTPRFGSRHALSPTRRERVMSKETFEALLAPNLRCVRTLVRARLSAPGMRRMWCMALVDRAERDPDVLPPRPRHHVFG